jgi:hypothetical protein
VVDRLVVGRIEKFPWEVKSGSIDQLRWTAFKIFFEGGPDSKHHNG